MTYTYTLLEVSATTYNEIAAKLHAAAYNDAFHEEGIIDMHGIALVHVSIKENKMADVFKGEADTRQSTNVAHQTSRFRPTYRALNDDEKKLHDEFKAKAVELESMFAQVKPGRYNSLAITALEQAIMWIVKELTS